MEDIKKEIQLTEDDYTHFQGIVCKSISQKSTLLSITTAMICFAIIGVLYTFLETLPFFNSFTTTTLVLFCGGSYIVIYIELYKYIHKYSKIELLAENGNFLSPKNTIIDEKGITETTKHSTGFTSWHGILKIENHKNIILFYIDNLQAYIIPKRIFENEEEENAFLKQAEEFWQNAKKSEAKERKRPWDTHANVTNHDEDT